MAKNNLLLARARRHRRRRAPSCPNNGMLGSPRVAHGFSRFSFVRNSQRIHAIFSLTDRTVVSPYYKTGDATHDCVSSRTLLRRRRKVVE